MIDTTHLRCGPLMRLNVPLLINFLIDRSKVCAAENSICRYLEIGIMSGDTLCGAAQALLKYSMTSRWFVVGVDLDGGPWIKPEDVVHQEDRIKSTLELFSPHIHRTMDLASEETHCHVYLTGSEPFLREIAVPFDVVLIDACHEGPCCTLDFILAEPIVKKGGILAFHDSEPQIQGRDLQQHSNHPIRVREVLECLGLLTNKRSGWVCEADLIHPPNSDRGMAFFRRTV